MRRLKHAQHSTYSLLSYRRGVAPFESEQRHQKPRSGGLGIVNVLIRFHAHDGLGQVRAVLWCERRLRRTCRPVWFQKCLELSYRLRAAQVLQPLAHAGGGVRQHRRQDMDTARERKHDVDAPQAARRVRQETHVRPHVTPRPNRAATAESHLVHSGAFCRAARRLAAFTTRFMDARFPASAPTRARCVVVYFSRRVSYASGFEAR